MNILVTGGAGFIGSHLINRLLSEGNKVTCIDNLSLGSEKLLFDIINDANFKFHNNDLVDLDKINNIFSNNNYDIIYHFAANSNIQLGAENHLIDYKNTFLSTINILECMKRYSVKRLVFASSKEKYQRIVAPFYQYRIMVLQSYHQRLLFLHIAIVII